VCLVYYDKQVRIVCVTVGATGEQVSLSKLFAGMTFLVTHIDQTSSSATPVSPYKGINGVFIL